MYYGRVVIGICVWALALLGSWWAIRSTYGDVAAEAHWSELLAEYATRSRQSVELTFEQAVFVAIGDPIYVLGPHGPKQVGEIASIPAPDRYAADVSAAQAVFYGGTPPLRTVDRIEYFRASSSLAGVLATLLPPEKREQVLTLLGDAFRKHEDEILAAFQPLLVDTVTAAASGLEDELAAAITRHQAELDALGVKYNREIVDAEIVPLMREVLLPIVRHRVEPIANQVGLELWQRASLWRFGWRYLYDTLPIMNDNLLEKEWGRFLSDEATPVLEKHADAIVEALGQVASDAFNSEKVRAVLRSSFNKVASDPEFQATMGSIFREVVIDNPRIRQVIADNWSGARFQNALSKVASKLEPTFREVGDVVLGSRDGGITPEFARVLRQQILDKDRRWFLLVQNSDPSVSAEQATSLPVVPAAEDAVWPPLNSERP